MGDRITFRDGLLEISVSTGQFDENTARLLIDEIEAAMRAHNGGRPTSILADTTGLKHMPVTLAGGRKVFADWVGSGRCPRAAIIGPSIFIRTVVRLIFRLAGLEERVRFFQSRAEAEAWLREEAIDG